jgi:hypothetical protein
MFRGGIPSAADVLKFVSGVTMENLTACNFLGDLMGNKRQPDLVERR